MNWGFLLRSLLMAVTLFTILGTIIGLIVWAMVVFGPKSMAVLAGVVLFLYVWWDMYSSLP